MSINASEKRGRGRPSIDQEAVHVRIPKETIAKLDAWREQQDPPLTRPKAVKSLLAKILDIVG